MTAKPVIKAILFDLDGTLVDTAPDFVAVLNQLRQEQQRPPLSPADLRPHVSGGATAMLAFAFASCNQQTLTALKKRFLHRYLDHLAQHSQYFPGVVGLLLQLQQRALPWAIVTNKPSQFTLPCLAKLNQKLDNLLTPAAVICADQVAAPKPNPAGLIAACQQLDCIAEHSIYIGDDQRDIDAARACGMRCLVAEFGYAQYHQHTPIQHADGQLTQPADLLAWL